MFIIKLFLSNLHTNIMLIFYSHNITKASHPCVEKRRDSRRTALWQQRPYRRYRSGSGTGLAVYGRGTRHQRRSRIFSPKPRHAGYVSGLSTATTAGSRIRLQIDAHAVQSVLHSFRIAKLKMWKSQHSISM